jgi:hypothetical protein
MMFSPIVYGLYVKQDASLVPKRKYICSHSNIPHFLVLRTSYPSCVVRLKMAMTLFKAWVPMCELVQVSELLTNIISPAVFRERYSCSIDEKLLRLSSGGRAHKNCPCPNPLNLLLKSRTYGLLLFSEAKK